MGRLKEAHDKQREYAKNEYLSGDEAKGDEHSAKAEAFLERILAGEDGEAPAGETAATEEPAAEPLSSDPDEARQQLLAATGHPREINAAGETVAVEAQAVIDGATDEQIRELALLGFFGQPGSYEGVDYSLFEQYYEPTPGQPGNWRPKGDPDQPTPNYWAEYVKSKEEAE